MMLLNVFLLVAFVVFLLQVKRVLKKKRSPLHAASLMLSLLGLLLVSAVL